MIGFIGLGNTGTSYSATKHNFGFWVVDELARRWNHSFRSGKGEYVYAKDEKKDVLLVKPTTGMNKSGIAVRDVMDRWGIPLSQIFLVVDDVDLDLGTIRIRPKGGDGCHQGMASVIQLLGDVNFPRIRVGIKTKAYIRPAEDYVLKPFKKEDHEKAEEIVGVTADALESVLSQGLEKTMSFFNRMEKEAV